MSKKLGQRVKAFRLEKGMTQKQAATFFGVSRATLARLEAGKGCGDLNRVKIERTIDKIQVAA